MLHGFFSSWDEQELLFWLLVAVASPVSVTGSKFHRLSSYGSQALEHRLWLWCMGLLLHNIWCLLHRGSNLCLLHWKADSLPLSHPNTCLNVFKCFKDFEVIDFLLKIQLFGNSLEAQWSGLCASNAEAQV